MNTFAVLFLCIQACLVKNVFGQYFSPAFAPASAIAPFGPALSPAGHSPFAYSPEFAPYGGIGEGNVAVAGELPVAGNTAVVGQVPIMGAVNFGGPVAAAGSVSVSGKCSCGVPCGYCY